nr:hypothetical protein Itr_chr09CG15140 [Ipomoea trifida]
MSQFHPYPKSHTFTHIISPNTSLCIHSRLLHCPVMRNTIYYFYLDISTYINHL